MVPLWSKHDLALAWYKYDLYMVKKLDMIWTSPFNQSESLTRSLKYLSSSEPGSKAGTTWGGVDASVPPYDLVHIDAKRVSSHHLLFPNFRI